MKKYFLLIVFALLAVSCSNKVEIKGKVNNGNPLDRIEVIEASGVATLPIINLGVNPKGEFQGEVEIPRNGMYVITLGQGMQMVYLKKGQSVELTASKGGNPLFVVGGEAKANNDFLTNVDLAFQKYASSIKVENLIAKKEDDFIKDINKMEADLDKVLEDNASKYKADKDVLEYKKLDIKSKVVGLVDTYEQGHGMMIGQANFKASEKFKAFANGFIKNKDKMIREIPMYRDYELRKLNSKFQEFVQAKNYMQSGEEPLMSQAFGDFLRTQKDLSSVEKDYFYAYVIAQSDLNQNKINKYDQITSLIEKNISNPAIEKDIKAIQKVLMGQKSGTNANLQLEDKDGEKSNLGDIKGKGSLVLYYASYSPNMNFVAPQIQEMANFYKDSINFVFVNLDDTKEQFLKTSTALWKNIPGQHFYVKGGVNSREAIRNGIYSFKMPSFILVDKEGRILGKPYFNLGDPELVEHLNKLSGKKAPEVKEEVMGMPFPAGTPGQ